MAQSGDTPVLRDEFAVLEPAAGCSIPGYLVLRVLTGARSLGELQPAAAGRLGALLAAAAGAVEAAVGADRVYCLSFCEVERRLHFHLFPRTPELLAAYHEATGTAGLPVNGPLLFEWARERFGPGAPPLPGWPAPAAVAERLRAVLGGP